MCGFLTYWENMILKFKSKIGLLILLIALIPTYREMLGPGFFPIHDDIQAMRLLQMDKCIKNFQIPCRWVPDMGFGYGYPQFNYYSPLPYYLMEVLHLSGFNYLDSVKAFFVIALITAAIGMFYLGKEFWGIKGGIVSALFYGFAPYFAYDLYVRGAVGELSAYAIMPFIFLFTKRLFQDSKYSIFYLALPLATLFTSHNITTVYFFPVTTLWFLYLLLIYSKKSTRPLKKYLSKFAISIIWGLALSAYFILPAIFEKHFVKTETLTYGYFNYVSHFVGLKQLLFNTLWGYGSSEPGPWDQAFLGIGILHWYFPILTVFLLWFFKKKKETLLVLGIITAGWIISFLIHPRSVFIWNNLNILSYFQFPWRLIMLVVFLYSFALGSLALTLKKGNVFTLGVFLSIYLTILVFYASYFRPSERIFLTDEEKFSGESWQLQQTVSINDYLPVYVKNAPTKEASFLPEVVFGQVDFLKIDKGTNWQDYEIDVRSDKAKIRLQVFYFPGWEVKIDETKVEIDIENDLGLITFDVESGLHKIQAKLRDTPIRIVSNFISFAALVYIPVYIYKRKR